jgi:hypothetical protein
MVRKIKRDVMRVPDSEDENSESEEDDFESEEECECEEYEIDDDEKIFLEDILKALDTKDLKIAIINVFLTSFKWVKYKIL